MKLDVLFDSAGAGCQVPGCEHKHEAVSEPVFLHPRCHPRGGTWVSVNGATRTLRIVCATCKKLVVEVECAS